MCEGTSISREYRKKLMKALDDYLNQMVKEGIEREKDKKDNYCPKCGKSQ